MVQKFIVAISGLVAVLAFACGFDDECELGPPRCEGSVRVICETYTPSSHIPDFQSNDPYNLLRREPCPSNLTCADVGERDLECLPAATRLDCRADRIIAVTPSSATATGDIDGDGRTDIVTLVRGMITPLRKRPDGMFEIRTGIEASATPSRIALVDLDVDGRLDVVLGGSDGLRIMRGTGDGLFAPPESLSPTTPRDLLVVDVDRDGLSDLVAPGDDRVVVVLARPSSFVFVTTDLEGNSVDRSSRAADIDGDGWVDLVVPTVRGLAALLGDGTGRFRHATIDMTIANAIEVVDLDGDGVSELVYSKSGETMLSIAHYRSWGFETTERVEAAIDAAELRLLDVDGDGDRDLLAMMSNQRVFSLLKNEGKTLVRRTSFMVPGTATFVTALDVDDDRKDDLLVGSLAGVRIVASGCD